MSGGIMDTVRRLAVPFIAVALFVGIGLGLLFGWQVWPVEWYDTDPSDLRAAHQEDYVLMIADSMAVNGDVDLAKKRLIELTDGDTSWEQVADLVAGVAAEEETRGEAASAVRVRQLTHAAELSQTPSERYDPPEKRISPAPRWVLLLMAIGAFVIALALVVWVVLRLLRARSSDVPYGELGARSPARAPATGSRRQGWQDARLDDGWDEDPQYALPPLSPAPAPPAQERPSAPPRTLPAAGPRLNGDTVSEDPSSTPGKSAAPPSFLSPVGRPGRRQSLKVPRGALAAFEAEYQFGDDDFDCSFSIETKDGDFVGECGVSVRDILEDEEAQHVDAFEIWLFDKVDIRTVSQILVSEYAYADETINAELSAKGDLVVAQPDSTVTLETMYLQLQATIADHAYLPDEEVPDGVFSRLNVALVVRQAD